MTRYQSSKKTCERLYGSFPSEMIEMIIEGSDDKLACSKSIERSRTIVYLVKHGLFIAKELSDYTRKILKFVTEINNSLEENEQ